MSLKRTKPQLIRECQLRGIQLDPSKKYRNQDYVSLLGQQSLANMQSPSKGLIQRLELDHPMTCFRYGDLRDEQKIECFDGDNWIADQKINGCRASLHYNPNEGFTFFGRDVTTIDYLPSDFTKNVLLKKDNIIVDSNKFKNAFTYNFVLDVELEATGNIPTLSSNQMTNSELNATIALLNMDVQASRHLQMTMCPLSIKVFHVLMYQDKWLLNQTLENNRKLMAPLLKYLNNFIDIEHVRTTHKNKREFFQGIIDNGGEGVVLKRLDSTYINTTGRRRDGWVKVKKSMSGSIGQDIDAFITGFKVGSEDAAFKNMIGSVEFSVFVRAKNGKEDQIVIANVAGMPLKLRKHMTVLDSEGNITLNPEYYNKVVVINGQSMSTRNFRLAHPTSEWQFRPDKTPHSCVLEKELLKANII